MSAWLSYSLSDLMMFSKDTYFRLFELHNRALWPGQLAVLAAAVAVAALALRGGPSAGRLISTILAGFWLACSWFFLLERYASIHLAAPLFAVAFALQALLLLWLGLVRNHFAVGKASRPAVAPGWMGVAFAFAGYPLLAPLSGRPWLQAELVGLAPDPTAAATLALAVLAARPPWVLVAIPIAWSLVSAATLWSLGARGQALTLPAMALLTIVVAGRRRVKPLRTCT